MLHSLNLHEKDGQSLGQDSGTDVGKSGWGILETCGIEETQQSLFEFKHFGVIAGSEYVAQRAV